MTHEPRISNNLLRREEERNIFRMGKAGRKTVWLEPRLWGDLRWDEAQIVCSGGYRMTNVEAAWPKWMLCFVRECTREWLLEYRSQSYCQVTLDGSRKTFSRTHAPLAHTARLRTDTGCACCACTKRKHKHLAEKITNGSCETCQNPLTLINANPYPSIEFECILLA